MSEVNTFEEWTKCLNRIKELEQNSIKLEIRNIHLESKIRYAIGVFGQLANKSPYNIVLAETAINKLEEKL